MTANQKILTYSRPAGRSLEEYKSWIRQMFTRMGVKDDVTDERWEASWRAFWSKAGSSE